MQREMMARAFLLACVGTACVGARAESWSETLERLDREVKSLKATVEALEKRSADPGSARPARDSSMALGLLLQKTSFERVQPAAPASSAAMAAFSIANAYTRSCRYTVKAIRVDNKSFEFSEILKIDLGGASGGVVAAEVEAFVECDSAQLKLELGTFFETWFKSPPRILVVPCPGAAAVSTSIRPGSKLGAFVGYFVSPSPALGFDSVRPDALAQGSWQCVTKFVPMLPP